MSDTLTTLLTTAGGAYLGKFVGPAAEAMGKAAWERAQQLGARATAMLTAAGREPQPIEPKLLVPLVQAASLEDAPNLAELWAAILANAADPEARVKVTMKFLEIMRTLSSEEVKILQYLDAQRKDDSLNYELNFSPLATRLGIAEQEFEIAADSLLSSRLCELPHDEFNINADGDLIQHTSSKDKLVLSSLGKAFMLSVAPPVP